MNYLHFVLIFIVVFATPVFLDRLKNEAQSIEGRVLTSFQRIDVINEYLDVLQENHEDIMNVVTAATTVQGNQLRYVQLSTTNFENSSKSLILIESGINPEEWISTVAALTIIAKVVEGGYGLTNFDWVVIPVLNPDGHEYTHTNIRMWQKSRSINSHLDVVCPGVNLNRNFDVDWQNRNSSSSPCSNIYAGIYPFSEVETEFLRDILSNLSTRNIFYVSIKNNGGYVTYPWSYQEGVFNEELDEIANKMANALGPDYEAGPASSLIGLTSGTSTDYAYATGIRHVFTIELREGHNGVQLEEDEIEQVTNNVWNAIRALINDPSELEISGSTAISFNKVFLLIVATLLKMFMRSY